MKVNNKISKKHKVWGIGLGRTGTKSLCGALNILGYKTIHNPPGLSEISSPDIDGCTEGTTALHFKYLDIRFPDSKFILTTREISSWLNSCDKAIKNIYPIDRFKKDDQFYNAMIRNRSSRYGGLDYNEEQLIAKYYQHHFDVVSHFKGRGNQLLIIDITNGDGWEKLCPFLDATMPAQNFPNVKL